MMRIYLAHSKNDYGTSYIHKIKERILRIYGEETFIVDPAMHKIDCVSEEERGGYFKNMFDVFYPLIRSCEVLVAVPDNESKRYTKGVMDEIKFAKKVGVSIWGM